MWKQELSGDAEKERSATSLLQRKNEREKGAGPRLLNQVELRQPSVVVARAAAP